MRCGANGCTHQPETLKNGATRGIAGQPVNFDGQVVRKDVEFSSPGSYHERMSSTASDSHIDKKTIRFLPKVSQSGFSMIEVLVAILILSIGMLGALGMQAAALQANKESRNQAIAGSLAKELAEKMRGNHTVALLTAAADNPYLIDATLTTTIAAPTPNCFTTACTAVRDVADWDMADWQTRVVNTLPTPRIKTCFDQTPFDADGKPQWACTNTGDVAVLKMSWTKSNTAGTLEFAASGIPAIIVPLTAGSSE